MKQDCSHLIIGNSEDYHAVAVAWALRLAGEEVAIWDGIGSEQHEQISIRAGHADFSSDVQLGGSRYRALKSLWFRRPVRYRPISDAADHVVEFVEQELRYSYWNLATALGRAAEFTVGDAFMGYAACKLHQLEVAKDLGFKIPSTLVTNSYEEAISFTTSRPTTVIKPFNPFFWQETGSRRMRVASTSIISSPNELSRESVEICPSIYQEYINKRYELRVTVIGNRVFTARISKKGGGSFIDWRPSITTEAVVEADTLEPSIETKVLNYVRTLGLQYGCIDLVVDTDGEMYFLEINPSGQFLFVEGFVPELPMLNAFTSMLVAQTCDYELFPSEDLSLPHFEMSPEFDRMQQRRGTVVVRPQGYKHVRTGEVKVADFT